MLWLVVSGGVYVQANTSSAFDYDGRSSSTMSYDGASYLPAAYDGAWVLLESKKLGYSESLCILFGQFADFLAAEGGSIAWNPLTGPGPLSDAVANTFRGGSYTETVLSGETTLYRAYGGTARELGSYWTATPPAGPLQSTIDSALNPAWDNTAQSVSTIRVPAGTTIYEGFAAPQGGLLGGGSQVYIPKVNPNWLVQP